MADRVDAHFAPARTLDGAVLAPPDKSISHRAALLGAFGDGKARISRYLDSADTLSTLDAVAALGASVDTGPCGPGALEVQIGGFGLRGATPPAGATIDAGNAGTLIRLLAGLLAGQEGRDFVLDGDESIRSRPMGRVAEPLLAMGASVETAEAGRPPVRIAGRRLQAIHYELPVASAQVKSCVLLAGLAADGATTVSEPAASRDHTERMLTAAGVTVHRNGRHVTVAGTDELTLDELAIPGDPSSAAFAIAAGVLVAGSRLILRGVGVNWTRSGFVRIAQRMGAIVIGDLEDEPGDEVAPTEPISDLDVTAGPLVGTVVEAEEVPLAIDELPLVALLGCFAEGETVVRGAHELRLKETDRIAAVVDGLSGLGASIEATEDGFAVTGTGSTHW